VARMCMRGGVLSPLPRSVGVQPCSVTWPLFSFGWPVVGMVKVEMSGEEGVQVKRMVGVALVVKMNAVEVEVMVLLLHRRWRL
jgi:hypothetical protein